MGNFSVGIVSVALAIAFPALYFFGFQLRRLGAWSKREDGPKDRVGFFLLVAAIFGFGMGCLAQPLWDKGTECKAAGQPVASCIFISK